MPLITVPQIPIAKTHHFEERSAQRRLPPAVLQFILAFGAAVRACGATHLTIIERRLPAHFRGTPLAKRARGWIVLETDEGELLTCYRRDDAVRFLQRKRKRRLSRAQLRGARRSLRDGGSPAIGFPVEMQGGVHAR